MKYKTIPPKHVVEALLADTILQVKLLFDTVYHKSSTKLNKVETLVSVYIATRANVEYVLSLFEGVQPNTMSPKHRFCVEILRLFLERLEENDLVQIKPKKASHTAVIQVAKDFIEFLKAFHLILHAGTPAREREQLLFTYKNHRGLRV